MMHFRSLARLLSLGAIPLGVALSSAACRAQDRTVASDTARVRAVVDSLLPRLQQLAGLRAEQPIRIGYRTRAEVRAYVVHQLDRDMPPEQMAGIQQAYAALGLIPDTMNLRRLLIDLYAEQVGGYYDPDTKTFYTVEGTPPGELRTVLAHELVHALQDQHTNLDSLVSRKRGNDRQSAAQAAVEGQATAVMFVVAMGVADPSRLPDLSAQLRPALEMQNARFPVFRRAPLVIREAILFPYLQGASFVQALWRAHAPRAPAVATGVWPAPLDSLLPQSTEQVMHPDSFLRLPRDNPTEVRIAAGGAASWKTGYEDSMGELETTVFLRQHLGEAAAPHAGIGWDGDEFRLLQGPAGERALVWYSVWDAPAAADAFADAYRRTLAVRPTRHANVERLTISGRPVVRVVDAPAGVALESIPVPEVALEGGLP
ncbi:MAG TPA: hypothetical protein VF832_16215 [Longimicrobiales bacterium]